MKLKLLAILGIFLIQVSFVFANSLNNILSGPFEMLFGLFDLQFIEQNPLPFVRFMYWFLVFTILYVGTSFVFNKSKNKSGKNISITLAFVIATIAVYFTPSETLLLIASSLAGIINTAIILAIATVILSLAYGSKGKIPYSLANLVGDKDCLLHLLRVPVILFTIIFLGVFQQVSKSISTSARFADNFQIAYDSIFGFIILILLILLIIELIRFFNCKFGSSDDGDDKKPPPPGTDPKILKFRPESVHINQVGTNVNFTFSGEYFPSNMTVVFAYESTTNGAPLNISYQRVINTKNGEGVLILDSSAKIGDRFEIYPVVNSNPITSGKCFAFEIIDGGGQPPLPPDDEPKILKFRPGKIPLSRVNTEIPFMYSGKKFPQNMQVIFHQPGHHSFAQHIQIKSHRVVDSQNGRGIMKPISPPAKAGDKFDIYPIVNNQPVQSGGCFAFEIIDNDGQPPSGDPQITEFKPKIVYKDKVGQRTLYVITGKNFPKTGMDLIFAFKDTQNVISFVKSTICTQTSDTQAHGKFDVLLPAKAGDEFDVYPVINGQPVVSGKCFAFEIIDRGGQPPPPPDEEIVIERIDPTSINIENKMCDITISGRNLDKLNNFMFYLDSSNIIQCSLQSKSSISCLVQIQIIDSSTPGKYECIGITHSNQYITSNVNLTLKKKGNSDSSKNAITRFIIDGKNVNGGKLDASKLSSNTVVVKNVGGGNLLVMYKAIANLTILEPTVNKVGHFVLKENEEKLLKFKKEKGQAALFILTKQGIKVDNQKIPDKINFTTLMKMKLQKFNKGQLLLKWEK